jgi:hypothetical protein
MYISFLYISLHNSPKGGGKSGGETLKRKELSPKHTEEL